MRHDLRTNLLAFVALGLSGCSALDVNSPTTLRAEDLQNAYGAVLAVNGVRQAYGGRLHFAMRGTGALTDEFWAIGEILNSRNADDYLESLRNVRANGIYYFWQEAYRKATVALPLVEKNAAPAGKGAMVGEVFALRGFVLIGLAEHVCPGIPIINLDIDSDVITPRYTSDPQTSDSVFNRAVADFDSAIAYAGDSVRVLYLAQIGKARALLGLGKFSEAADAVSSVPTDYVYETLPQYMGTLATYYVVKWHKGGNGIDYVTPNDPRVPLLYRFPSDFGDLMSFAKYVSFPAEYRPIVVANGIEARLIESEGQLAAEPDGTEWLSTLNDLRETVALPDTTNPATLSERVNLLFRERAFWLFGTAHRLGDLRRLMSRYGRDPETLFPTGTKLDDGKPYGTLTSVPFDGDYEHQYNPKITGCTGP